MANEFTQVKDQNEVIHPVCDSTARSSISGILDGTTIDSFADVESALSGKEDTLTFDDTPTASSTNPVKSGGVYSGIQDVYEVNGVLGAKNLLLNNAISTGIFTVNGNKSITINGTTSARTTLSLAVAGDNFHPNANNYILSLSETDENVELVIDAYNGSTWVKNISNAKTDTSITIDYDGYDRITAYLLISAGVTISNKTVYPMLRLASDTDSTYVPYAMTNRELTEEVAPIACPLTTAGTYTLSATVDSDGNVTYSWA